MDFIFKAVMANDHFEVPAGKSTGRRTVHIGELSSLTLEQLDATYAALTAEVSPKAVSLMSNTKTDAVLERKLQVVQAIFTAKKELADKVAKAVETRRLNAAYNEMAMEAKLKVQREVLDGLTPEQLTNFMELSAEDKETFFAAKAAPATKKK